MKTIFVMVVFNQYQLWKWTELSVNSFRKYFPDSPFLVVDHNHYAPERSFLESSGAILLDHDGLTTHGGGLDAARTWCLEHNYDVMVHFEPDCIISGTNWYSNLTTSIKRGNWMSGACKLSQGPIHPCPSAWLLEKFNYTFHMCLRGKDITHPRYQELIPFSRHLEWVESQPRDWNNYSFCNYYWDTGLKNWFDAAVHDKAELVGGCEDIHHYWYGRERGPEKHDFFRQLSFL